MAVKNMSDEAGLESVLPRSNNTKTALYKERLNVRCSCSLLECDTATEL